MRVGRAAGTLDLLVGAGGRQPVFLPFARKKSSLEPAKFQRALSNQFGV
jgi:hypothetical protein